MSQGHKPDKLENVKKAADSCSIPQCVGKGHEVFGDVWTLFIIRSLSDGEKRFCEIQRKVGGVNPVTLTSRLKKLEKMGFIERKKELIDKLSVSYSLTKKGEGMLPVLLAIETYAKKYLN
ncbi:helix-turn-helix transcriptional regulator [Candidatus Peregrinibacteria bacterium]|nr:helix-turn-helix transcriptional regulator [Candidatus Peregrinibacteria bacterium]